MAKPVLWMGHVLRPNFLSVVIEQKGVETFSVSPEQQRGCSLYWERRFSFLEWRWTLPKGFSNCQPEGFSVVPSGTNSASSG